MPHVIIKLLAGRSDEQKRRLADEVAKAVTSAVGVPDSAVSVALEDVAPEDWAGKVYDPDITGETLNDLQATGISAPVTHEAGMSSTAVRLARRSQQEVTMKRSVFAALLAIGLTGPAYAQEAMQVWPNGSRPSGKGPEANFTGPVRTDPLFPSNEFINASGGLVTFESGSRSAWHSHPAGQTLAVMSGTGWVQERTGAKREIKPGDVIWTPPGIAHWHGATATNGMSHIAISGTVDGRNVDWLEKVTEEDYRK